MASIIIGAGVLAYDQVQKTRQKKKDKRAHSDARFAELEQENSTRIAQLQQGTCFCQRSDWRGGGCPNHGYVPPAPGYTERVEDNENAAEARIRNGVSSVEQYPAPGYNEPTALPSNTASPVTRRENDRQPSARTGPYEYRRGEEEGAFAERTKPPQSMGVDEVRRINEERRKRMKIGGFTNFILRWKKNGGDKVKVQTQESDVQGDGLVR